MDAYSQYIASVAWAEKRMARLEIDGHKCQTCFHDGAQWRLEVHHKTYERLGDEDVQKDLITLCCDCHAAITSVIRERRYADKPILVSFVRSSEVSITRSDFDGMEDSLVSHHRGRSADYAQRLSRRPVEQRREAVEAGNVKTQEDRRGLRAYG
jgi:hypothetical protein